MSGRGATASIRLTSGGGQNLVESGQSTERVSRPYHVHNRTPESVYTRAVVEQRATMRRFSTANFIHVGTGERESGVASRETGVTFTVSLCDQ